MIDVPIIDTHLHLWDPQRLSYSWLASVPKINRQFVPRDYDLATAPYKIAKMIFVQCEVDPSQYRDEVAWVTGLAREESRISGIVAWAPLEKGEAVEQELAALAANPLVKGVRRIIQFEPDDNFCLQPAFIAGVQFLAKFNLSFDICIKGAQQTANTISLVRQCPNVRFILDHIGKPGIAQRRLDPWKSQIRELASMPNVWCKMSGLVVEADHENWTPADLRPYVDHVLESFGMNRVMFGGDWPVILQASTIPRWIDAMVALTANYSRSERTRLFRDNAEAFYRLT